MHTHPFLNWTKSLWADVQFSQNELCNLASLGSVSLVSWMLFLVSNPQAGQKLGEKESWLILTKLKTNNLEIANTFKTISSMPQLEQAHQVWKMSSKSPRHTGVSFLLLISIQSKSSFSKN